MTTFRLICPVIMGTAGRLRLGGRPAYTLKVEFCLLNSKDQVISTG